jgi:hypothetical protein
MENDGDKFVFYLRVSSSNGWIDISCEKNLGRFVKEPSD